MSTPFTKLVSNIRRNSNSHIQTNIACLSQTQTQTNYQFRQSFSLHTISNINNSISTINSSSNSNNNNHIYNRYNNNSSINHFITNYNNSTLYYQTNYFFNSKAATATKNDEIEGIPEISGNFDKKSSEGSKKGKKGEENDASVLSAALNNDDESENENESDLDSDIDSESDLSSDSENDSASDLESSESETDEEEDDELYTDSDSDSEEDETESDSDSDSESDSDFSESDSDSDSSSDEDEEEDDKTDTMFSSKSRTNANARARTNNTQDRGFSNTNKMQTSVHDGSSLSSVMEDRLIVKGLNYHSTRGDIWELFSEYGKVTDVHVPTSKENMNQNRGFAFVTFDNKQDAQNAYDKMQNMEFQSRFIKLDFAIKRNNEMNFNSNNSNSNSNRGNRGYNRDSDSNSGFGAFGSRMEDTAQNMQATRGNANIMDIFDTKSSSEGSSSNAVMNDGLSETTISINNLPSFVDSNTIERLFAELGIVSNVRLSSFEQCGYQLNNAIFKLQIDQANSNNSNVSNNSTNSSNNIFNVSSAAPGVSSAFGSDLSGGSVTNLINDVFNDGKRDSNGNSKDKVLASSTKNELSGSSNTDKNDDKDLFDELFDSDSDSDLDEASDSDLSDDE